MFTLLSIVMAFLLFGLLDSVRSAFSSTGQAIALSMVVRHEVGNRVLERGLSEEDHSVQALGIY